MKYVMHLKYDGDCFNGFATQLHKNTVEDKVNENLSMLLNEDIKLVGSARTDSKVHAYDQVIMFNVNKELDCIDFKYKFNRTINNAITCTKLYIKDDDFHVRYDMQSKTYVYKITKTYDPFYRRYAFCYNSEIEIDKLKRNCELFIGTHNFKSFCKEDKQNDYIRTINFIDVKENGNLVTITINGDGFLYNMVRIMVGTLLDINEDKIDLSITEIISKENRVYAGKTAPAQGLYLHESIY